MESINKIGGLLLWSDTNAWGNSGALLWFRTTPGRRWGRHGETEWERRDLRGSNLGAICAHCVSQISSRNKVWRQILLAAFHSFLYKMFLFLSMPLLKMPLSLWVLTLISLWWAWGIPCHKTDSVQSEKTQRGHAMFRQYMLHGCISTRSTYRRTLASFRSTETSYPQEIGMVDEWNFFR